MDALSPSGAAHGPIGIFDSGVGGLSVWQSIRAALPCEDLVYLADSGRAPYGDKPAAWIEERTGELADFLFAQGCKAVVIACNTATMVAAARLRRRHESPIIAIEPAIKPAAQGSRSASVALMATTRTLDSEGLRRLVREHARDVELIPLPCPGLADHVEALRLEGPELEQELLRRLRPALDSRADTLVLGCTHYPFLRPVIERVTDHRFQIIEPSYAVAAQLKRRLAERSLLNPGTSAGRTHFWTSADDLAHAARVVAVLGKIDPPLVRRLPEAGE